MSDVQVYCLDGSLQCGMGEEIALEITRGYLEKKGIPVSHSKKGRVPYTIMAQCGLPTGKCNIHAIEESNFTKALASGFQLWPYDARSMEVYKPDGSLQCGWGREIPLEVMEKELVDAGVQVISSRKGHDGLRHIFLCGAATGSINIYQIPSSDWLPAHGMGFSWFHGPFKGGGEGDVVATAREDDDGPIIPWPW